VAEAVSGAAGGRSVMAEVGAVSGEMEKGEVETVSGATAG
jgi:hypothetical protein